MRLREVGGGSRGGQGCVPCTALGEMWLLSPSNLGDLGPSPARQSFRVSFFLQALSAVLRTESRLWPAWPGSCPCLPESVCEAPVWVTVPSPFPYLFALLQPLRSSGRPAVPQTPQAGPRLRPFAVPIAWAPLFPGIPWLAPSFRLGLCWTSPSQRGLPQPPHSQQHPFLAGTYPVCFVYWPVPDSSAEVAASCHLLTSLSLGLKQCLALSRCRVCYLLRE